MPVSNEKQLIVVELRKSTIQANYDCEFSLRDAYAPKWATVMRTSSPNYNWNNNIFPYVSAAQHSKHIAIFAQSRHFHIVFCKKEIMNEQNFLFFCLPHQDGNQAISNYATMSLVARGYLGGNSGEIELIPPKRQVFFVSRWIEKPLSASVTFIFHSLSIKNA